MCIRLYLYVNLFFIYRFFSNCLWNVYPFLFVYVYVIYTYVRYVMRARMCVYVVNKLKHDI